jgi:glycosyltransferase involved in cell wall biosynthesis
MTMEPRSFRVLHVSDYASSYEGAFIRQLRMLDEDIRARGGRSSAFALTQPALDRAWARELAADHWCLNHLPPSGTNARRPAVDAIIDAIERSQPTVVHVHFGTYDLAARAAVTKLRARGGQWQDLQLVWHYRTALEVPVAQRSITRRIKDYIKFARASRDTNLVVGVTQAVADEAIARGVDANRVRGIVAGTDTETFRVDTETRARVRAELGVADDQTMLFHMGWHWQRKGGDLLAGAMQRLQERGHRDVVAYSVGAPVDAELGAVRALPMTDRVWELHQASDIFLSASRSEAFGNGLVEAMACERVAVAACAEGQVETFVGLDGVIPVAVDDSDALAIGVEQLLGARETWSVRGAANRAHVLEHHSMRRWARDMADAYAQLVPGAYLPSADVRVGDAA